MPRIFAGVLTTVSWLWACSLEVVENALYSVVSHESLVDDGYRIRRIDCQYQLSAAHIQTSGRRGAHEGKLDILGQRRGDQPGGHQRRRLVAWTGSNYPDLIIGTITGGDCT